METLEAIKSRASLKTHLSPREIEQEKITKILDAARLAPSARNMQPWRFIIVKGKEAIRKLASEVLPEGNRVIEEAPVIIIACANPGDDMVRDGKEYYLFDVALAVENMVLAATDLGLVTHLMTNLDEGKLKTVLGIPDDVRFVAATPLAYPAEGSYEKAAQERLSQRTRKDMNEVVYLNAWGKPL
ncbi:nitroreductase family protein [Chloroflexota bacterium]